MSMNMTEKPTLPDQFVLSIQINIEGLPLFKSASDHFWPIFGMISNLGLKKTLCDRSVLWDDKAR